MKYLSLCLLLLGFWGTCAKGEAQVIIDNFDSYVSGSYIQAQNPAWSRFGATADGINSIAAGYSGRGAAYSAGWASGTSGSVRYAFSTAVDLSATPILTLQLQEKTADVSGTMVKAVIADASGTTFTVTSPLSLTTSYQLFSFDFTTATQTGADSLTTVLSNPSTLTVTFTNTGGVGSQTIYFDSVQLSAAAVPEPSAASLVPFGLSFGAVAWWFRRQRKARL